MGFRKVPTIYTLEFDGEYEGLIVRMKSTSLGKMRTLLNLLDGKEDDTETMRFIDELIKLVSKQIVSWNLEEESEGGEWVVIEPSVEGLYDQDMKLIIDIANKYLGTISGPGDDLGKDSPAGEQFPGVPPTMEAL